MKKPVRVILLDNADLEYKRLNELVGNQQEEGKDNTPEMQLLRSINQKRDLIKANPFMEIILKRKRFLKFTIMFRIYGE